MKLSLAVAALLGLAQSKADVSQEQKDRCLALSMSGGGALGAYEAGALWGMYFGSEDKSKFEYDVMTGVSAGSINSMATAVFDIGDEENMIKDLSSRWENLSQDDLEVNWKPFGIVTGLRKHSGVLNTAPLGEYLTTFMEEHDWTFKRRVMFSAVDINSGAYRVYSETTDDPVKAVLSSAAIPFVFPNQHWPQNYYDMDGGTVWNLNLVSAVKRCREIVDDDSKITIDIIVCHAGKKFSDWEDKDKAIGNFMRYKEIKDVYSSNADIWLFQQAYPDVNFRYYVEPSGPLPGGLSIIKVDNATVTWPAQMMGRKDGANVVDQGEGKGFEKLNAWMAEHEQVVKKGTVDLEFMQE